jgi:hypothetical protein
MTTTKLAATVVSTLLLAGPAFSQGGLGSAVRQAKRAADATRLALELKRISEALKPADEEELDRLSKHGRAALAKLRDESLSSEGLTALDKLDAVYKDLPKRTWAEDYALDLAAIIALTPGWVADEGGSVEQMNKRFDESFPIPDAQPDSDELIKLFPEDVPLEKFKHICPITIFLMKHRLKRPKTITKTTPEDLIANKLHVQVGAQVEGVVTWATGGREFDRDYCFNIGDLHLEITPEWLLTHRGFIKPKVGDKVRVTGWTYWDYFHPAEHDLDEPGSRRTTDWEIHPVQSIERIK